MTAKPKILLLADKRDWAYDHSAQSIKALLSDEFDFQIVYVAENPVEAAQVFAPDIVHIFWWGENWQHRLNLPRTRIIKEVSSFRWREEAQFGHLDAPTFVERYLADAATLITTSRKMEAILNPIRPIFYAPNGIDAQTFYIQSARSGPLTVGWAGNINDACKGIREIVMPACEGVYKLVIAPGTIKSRDTMRAFYNTVDVFCIASTAEGQPLPLIESLACGCFPVSVDVGIVPEMITQGQNGLIVERSVPAFRTALDWCQANLDKIRGDAQNRAATAIKVRSWQEIIHYTRTAYRHALTGTQG